MNMRYENQVGYPNVRGRCPSCLSETLFLGSGGYLTCSLIGCPNPDAANELLNKLLSFSQRNKQRCESPKGFNHKLESWSLSDWITATTGELGEAANIIKKLNRVRDGVPGNTESAEQLRAHLADELADVAIYLDLLAQAAGFDLLTIREAKFAKTNAKIGYAE